MFKTYTFKRGEPCEISVSEFEADSKVEGKNYPINHRCDLINHSPTGLEWGYFGSGPAQAALAVLADYWSDATKLNGRLCRLVSDVPSPRGNGDRLAMMFHHRFKTDVIGVMSRNQVTTVLDQTAIEDWINREVLS